MTRRFLKLEQEIDELKCKLQDTQRQSDSLSNFENCKAKDSNAAFYTGFQSWDTLMAVFKYLGPGERGQKLITTLSLLTMRTDFQQRGGELDL